jgi:hypothetical protein
MKILRLLSQDEDFILGLMRSKLRDQEDFLVVTADCENIANKYPLLADLFKGVKEYLVLTKEEKDKLQSKIDNEDWASH